MSREASLQELLVSYFDNQTEELYTAIPAVVLTVRNNLQELSVDVQPAVNRKNRDETVTELPPILNVPVIMPASKTAAFLFPINVGDNVLLVFSMRGLDTFKRGAGKPTTPSDLRKFDIRDAVAIPGLFPFGNSVMSPSKHIWTHDPKDTVVVGNIGSGEETEVRIKSSGGIVINSYQDVEVNCRKASVIATDEIDLIAPVLSVDVANTTWVGNINQSGTHTLDGIVMNTHKHTGVQTGSGTSAGPVN